MSIKDDSISYTFGFLSLMVVIYRIAFVMFPMASQALKDNDTAELFKSFTLLV